MMAKTHGSVRMGPMSILVLVVVLCLAVLAVLTASTANATYASAERQATFTAETYANESVAQTFVAGLDDTLAKAREANNVTQTVFDDDLEEYIEVEAGPLSSEACANAVNKALGTLLQTCAERDGSCTVEASVQDGKLSATFTSEHGRTLNIVIALAEGGTYTIEQWKTSAEWSNETNDTLWTGNAGQTNTQGDAQ